jgi:ATP-dependent DNA helicase RecG
MPVSLLPEMRFPTAGQMGHGDQIIHANVYKKQQNTIGYVRQTDIDKIRYNELILKLAKKKGSVTRADVSELLHISPAQAYRLLSKLKENGKLHLVGSGKMAYYILMNK